MNVASGVLLNPAAHDGVRIVIGTVVDHQHFDAAISLASNRLERVGYQVRAIIGGYDDRN
jgi:hypothetical protein